MMRSPLGVQQYVEPGPLVSLLDGHLHDSGFQPHEKYREMRNLAIRLERRLMMVEHRHLFKELMESYDTPDSPEAFYIAMDRFRDYYRMNFEHEKEYEEHD